MTSREKVLKTLNFVQPDKVAVDFGSYHSSGIMAIAYNKLRNYLGLPKKLPKVYDIPQQLAIIDDDVLEQFGVDVIDMGPKGFCQDDSYWKPWVLPDGTDCLIPKWINMVKEGDNYTVAHDDGTPLAIQKKGMIYFEQIHFPLLENPEEKIDRLEDLFEYNMWSALLGFPKPWTYDKEGIEYLREGAKCLREKESRAIVGNFGGSLFEIGHAFFKMDNFYYQLVTNPDLINKYLDKLMEIYIRDLESYLKAVGPYIDVIGFSDDYGMQTGLQISKEMFRKFFKPRHSRLWHYAKELADVKTMLHSCGSIIELIPDFVEAGLDIVNPVQINAKNMEPERLKKEYGRSIVFWGGGCDTQKVLPDATPKEIREHVLRNLEILSPGGGFVFHQVHNIMANVSPENIVAMFDAVSEWNS